MDTVIHIIVPVARFPPHEHVLDFGKGILTLNRLSETLHKFYTSSLTEEQIEYVKTYNDDYFEYKKNCLKKYEDGMRVSYKDLMGDKVHFEGLRRVDTNVWRLQLGS
jgi:hypothetical protein